MTDDAAPDALGSLYARASKVRQSLSDRDAGPKLAPTEGGAGSLRRGGRATDKLLNKQFGLSLAGMFLGESGDPHDAYVSPLHANLIGLPPIYIQASDAETLLDDSRSFAERARQAGVQVRLDLFPGEQHTFQMAVGRSELADDAIRRLAEGVRPQLGL